MERLRRLEERGEALLLVLEERGHLVAREVEQADHGGPLPELAEDGRELGQVILFRGPAIGAGEGDLGAQQADAGGAAGQAQPGLGGRGDVAQHRDRLAVGRLDLRRRGGGGGPLGRGFRCGGGEIGFGGIDDELPRGGVEDRVVPGRRGQHPGVGSGQHGQAEAAGDDRRVRAGPAADRDRAGQARLGQPDEVGRVDLAADQDEVTGRKRRGFGARKVADHGLGHLADVARALGQVRVGQRGQQPGLGLAGLADGVRAVGAGPHRLKCLVDQGGVPRDQRGDVDDAGLQVLALVAEFGGQGGAVLGHGGEGGANVVLGRGPMSVGFAEGVAEVDLAQAGPFGYRLPAVTAGSGHRPVRAASRRAPRMSAVETAPGSSWPTLRGPR